MFRISVTALTIACLLAAPATAQQTQAQQDRQALLDAQARMNAAPDLTKQPVATLTCAQMLAEMSGAGRMMSQQLDPTFAANAQALQREALSGNTNPNAGQPPTAAQAQQNIERTDHLAAQVVGSMQGIDIQRMAAISDRFEAQKCPTPTGPAPG